MTPIKAFLQHPCTLWCPLQIMHDVHTLATYITSKNAC